MTEEPKFFQFYGRRKGKPLRRHHLDLMQALLPRLRLDPSQVDPAQDNWLEIGFGGGEHLAHQAALQPDTAFIGAEPYINGIAKLLDLIERRQLQNIRIFNEDARYLLRELPRYCLSRAYLLYPDPWPKARQNKRRFVNDDNLTSLAHVLKPGGLFLFASDIADYVEWTKAAIAGHADFDLMSDSDQAFEGWVETRYEAKARREGRNSRYLTARRH